VGSDRTFDPECIHMQQKKCLTKHIQLYIENTAEGYVQYGAHSTTGETNGRATSLDNNIAGE
jgi:hypothetical protein